MATTSTLTSKEGIVWRFVNPVSYGTYINSDYWVVGPVMVSSVSPSTVLRADLTAKHGSMLASQLSTSVQGFDGAATFQYPYDSTLNAGNYISDSSPLILSPGTRLISVSSTDGYPIISVASVLTCVSATVESSYFRPGYTDSSIDSLSSEYFVATSGNRFANFDLTTLRSIITPGKTEATYNNLLSSVSSFWFDPFPGQNSRFLRPGTSMPLEDTLIAAAISNAALTINYYNSLITKSTIATHLTQIGIDNYSNLVNLGTSWAGRGPFGSSKKFTMLFAGMLLGNEDMLNVGRDYTVTLGATNKFPEDNQTFFVASGASGINYGYGNYVTSDIGLPEWGITHWSDPSYDSSQWVDTSSYGSDQRRFFSMKNWVGYLFASKIMGLQNHWNNPALFYYFNRYFQKELEIYGYVTSGNIKDSLAPDGMEWQYDYVSGFNSEYFSATSNDNIDGIEYFGIASEPNLALYVSSYNRSTLEVKLLVPNPPIQGSGVLLFGSSLLPFPVISNAGADTSSIVYVANGIPSNYSLASSSPTLDTYLLNLPTSDDYYAQIVWINAAGVIDSTNAIKISRTQPY